MTESEGSGLVPVDSFRVRLAIVRALMGWNYEEAQEATGVHAESWRLWEKGARNCSTKTDVAAAIAQVTPYSKEWIAFGGPLRAEVSPSRPSPRRKAAHSSRVSSAGTGRSLTTPVTPTRYQFSRNVIVAVPPVTQAA